MRLEERMPEFQLHGLSKDIVDIVASGAIGQGITTNMHMCHNHNSSNQHSKSPT